MKDNQFRNGFMAAVFLMIGIAVAGMSVKSIFPSVGEAFVLESVPEYPAVFSDISDNGAPLEIGSASAEQSAPVWQSQSSTSVISEPAVELPVISSIAESASSSSAVTPEPTTLDPEPQSSVSLITPQSSASIPQSSVSQSTQQGAVKHRDFRSADHPRTYRHYQYQHRLKPPAAKAEWNRRGQGSGDN